MMKCPNCSSINCTNIETRNAPINRIRRRKECNECGSRFTTYEVYIPDGEDVRDYWMMFKPGKGGRRNG